MCMFVCLGVWMSVVCVWSSCLGMFADVLTARYSTISRRPLLFAALMHRIQAACYIAHTACAQPITPSPCMITLLLAVTFPFRDLTSTRCSGHYIEAVIDSMRYIFASLCFSYWADLVLILACFY